MLNTANKAFIPWLSCLIVGIYYAYEMLQLALGATLSNELLRTLHFSVTQLSVFSSSYLYACAIAIIPAGLLLDRLPIKPLLLSSLVLVIIGVFIMANASNFQWMTVGRACTGFSSDFAFLGYLTMASRYFTGKAAAFAKSLVYSMGALGCIISQTPVTAIMQHIGWRSLLIWLGIIGIALFFLIWAGVRNIPPSRLHTTPSQTVSIWHSLKLAAANKQNLLCAYYACIANFPLMLLGVLWSQIYLTKVLHLSTLQASTVNSLIFWGALFGSPLLGWLAGFFQQRRLMLGIAFVGSACWLCLAFMPKNIYSLSILFAIFGILVNSQLYSVIAVSKLNPKHIAATSLSVVSIANNAGGAVYQLFFAWLLTSLRPDSCHAQACLYSANTFNFIFMLIAANYLLGALNAYFIQDPK
jgi:predicted MFS family arabinose efflux permease